MTRRSETVSRGRDGGPPAGWRVAARVLLVIGLVQLVGFVLTGGHVSLGPWIVFPFIFFWAFAGPLGWRGRGDRNARRGADEGWDDQPALDGRREVALEREHHLEAELAGARRQIRELEDQLRWQARLLEQAPRETAPPEPRSGATPPG